MRFLVFLVLLLVIAHCHSRFVYDEAAETEVIGNCTVVYTVSGNSSCDLYKKWTLAGIINRVGAVESPPCFQKSGTLTQNFITLQFESTPHNLSSAIYKYPFAFTGEKLSHYGYHGSYELGDAEGEIVLEIGASPLDGVDQKIANYESKFFTILSQATDFEIKDNQLFISAGDKKLAFFTTEC